MEDNRFELFCSLTGSAAKSIARLKAARMDEFHLTAAHTQCLCLLFESMPAGLTQTELARRIGSVRIEEPAWLRTDEALNTPEQLAAATDALLIRLRGQRRRSLRRRLRQLLH